MKAKTDPTITMEIVHDPLSEYYRDYQGQDFSVSALVAAARDLEPFDVPIKCLDLGAVLGWCNHGIINLARHIHQAMNTDLEQPIILDWNGAIADGRHRVVKALLEGHETIKAVRLLRQIEPLKGG